MSGFSRFIRTICIVLIGVFNISTLGMALRRYVAPVEIPPEPQEAQLIELDAMPDTYSAADGLGRVLPTNEETGDPDEEKFVGMFYWTWHVGQSNSVERIVNVNNIIEQYPEAIHDLDFELWNDFAVPNFWNESIFGYYKTDDRWVLRRHAEMLANAGVDVIIFDNTNGQYTWKDSYDVLFEVFAQAREDGVKTPKIAFMLPFADGEDTVAQLRMLYDDVYSRGRYRNLWFYWKGKPLIMAHSKQIEKSTDTTDMEITQFFTFRSPIPEYYKSADDKRNENSKPLQRDRRMYWSWLSVYPQVVNKTYDGKVEQMAVGTAQNYSKELGLTAMNGENVFGRTYTHRHGYDLSENAVLYGPNFAEQCERALEVDPEFVFITGWNEWIMGRFEEWCGVTNAFPDHFNDTYSRDIEPSKGKLGDNYYYQMVDFIRRYKGVRAVEADTANTTVQSMDDWQSIRGFYAYKGNTFDRDAPGYADTHYTDRTGRNDFTGVKTASDSEKLYFYAECADNITPSTDENWMRLLLDTGESENSWEGYEYIVNRASPEDGKAIVERSTGGYNWEAVCQADIVVDGNALYIAVPKSALGINTNEFTVNFKWSDNTLAHGDINDFYLHGDTAPGGRFNYVYKKG